MSRQRTGVAPTFDQLLSSETVVIGGRAQFRCVIKGQPAPTITWYFAVFYYRRRTSEINVVFVSFSLNGPLGLVSLTLTFTVCNCEVSGVPIEKVRLYYTDMLIN